MTREDLDILLVHLLRHPQVVQMAVGKQLNADDFDQSTERMHSILWNVSQILWAHYGRILDKSYFYAAAMKAIQGSEVDDPNFRQALGSMIEGCWQVGDDSLLAPYAFQLLEEFLLERRVNSAMMSRIEEYGGNVPHRIWEDMQTMRASIRVSSDAGIKPFVGLARLDMTPRVPTGVDFIDQLAGGGFRYGELIGFLAPSSGGKTTLCAQLASSFCKTNHRALILSYEEATSPEYLSKFYATSAGLSLNDLDKRVRQESDLNELEQGKLDQARKDIGDRLTIMDMSGGDSSGRGNGGVEEVDAVLMAQAALGEKPDGVIIDWLWPMVLRRFSLDTNKRNSSDERKYSQVIVDRLKQLAMRHNCWIWLTHQLAPSKSGSKKVEWYDSAEAKSFAWFLNGCFTLTTLNKDHMGTFRYSKARSTSKGDVTVELKGEFARFIMLDGDRVYDNRTGEYKKAGMENANTEGLSPAEVSSLVKQYEQGASVNI